MRAFTWPVAVLTLAWAASASAADLFVDASNGADGNDGLTWATARKTIGSAVASATASPGPDVVSVAEGVYVENLVVRGETALLGGYPPGGGTRDPIVSQTVIDGNGLGPVVNFLQGSDGSLIDGFTVRGGSFDVGGGILVSGAAVTIRDNVIEDNVACRGGGIAVGDVPDGLTTRIEGNWIRRNSASLVSPPPCPRTGGGIWAVGSLTGSLICTGNRLSENEASLGGAAYLRLARVEHDVYENNSSGLHSNDGVTMFNVAITGNRDAAVTQGCADTLTLENVTLAGNGVGILDAGNGVDVVNSILWDETPITPCSGATPRVTSSIVRGGYPAGTNVIDADPLFVPGPLGDHYLSQLAAGQATTSPAVDAGSVTASTNGLDVRTTATSSAGDAGTVDLGYHYRALAALAIERGTRPDALAPYRVVASLPFTDDPGTLSAPPVLFYRVPDAENELGVIKDIATDAVTLVFLVR